MNNKQQQCFGNETYFYFFSPTVTQKIESHTAIHPCFDTHESANLRKFG